MTRLFRYAQSAVAETLRFADKISFSLDQIKQNYPHEPVPPGKTADEHLRDLTNSGLKRRYPDGTPFKIARQAVKELSAVISSTASSTGLGTGRLTVKVRRK